MRNPAVQIAAIIAVVLLEILALSHGYNGTLLRVALVLVAGIGGFSLARIAHRKDKD